MTFALSMLERVIEERARGDLTAAAAIRAEVNRLVGDDLARLKPGSAEAAPEAGADRAGRLEPVPGGRHRPGCRDLHQGAADGRGRHRHGCRDPSELILEQPGARGGAGRFVDRAHRRRDAGQRRQPARRGGPLGAAAQQGEGQQRVLRHRPVAALVRCTVHAGRHPPDDGVAERAGDDGFRLEGASSIARSAAIRRTWWRRW